MGTMNTSQTVVDVVTVRKHPFRILFSLSLTFVGVGIGENLISKE